MKGDKGDDAMVSLERALRKHHSREEMVKAVPEELDEAAIGQVECSERQRAGHACGGQLGQKRGLQAGAGGAAGGRQGH